MRILDCKSPECQEVCKGAPSILDYLCEDCKAHFQKVQDYLTALGVEFEIDPGLVRGLDYYTPHRVRVPLQEPGLCPGRRRPVRRPGGGVWRQAPPGLGFGLGLDRIMMALEAQKVEFPQPVKCELYIATMGEEAQKKAFLLMDELHTAAASPPTRTCAAGA